MPTEFLSENEKINIRKLILAGNWEGMKLVMTEITRLENVIKKQEGSYIGFNAGNYNLEVLNF